MKTNRITALVASTVVIFGTGNAAAQTAATPVVAPFAVAQATDTQLSCPQLATEMGRVATVMAGAATQSVANASRTVETGTGTTGLAQADAALAAAARATPGGLEALGRQVQQAQNMQQLGQLQAQAAAAGISRGTATAAIGGLAAMQQIAANGGHIDEAAASMAADTASSELAKRIPGGALIGGLMGGMFKKKKKVQQAVAAAAPSAEPNLMPLAQQRLSFLQSLMVSKNCH